MTAVNLRRKDRRDGPVAQPFARASPMSTAFALSSQLVLPFWALMVFLPRWRPQERAGSSAGAR